MSKKYYLMSRDIVIAELCLQGKVLHTVKQYRKPIIIGDFDEWLNSRFSPVTRKNTLKILKAMQIHTRTEMLDVTKALSMTDAFWIKGENDRLTWKDLDPHINRMSRIAANIALGLGYNGSLYKSPVSELCLGGSYDKCWIRKNGEIYLLKLSTPKWNDATGNESYSEVLCAQLAKFLGIKKYVSYTCKKRSINKTDCVIQSECKCYTTENESFMPIVFTRYKNCSLKDLNSLYEKLGDGRDFRLMLLMDALDGNTDRHKENYGLIYDNRNFNILGMAPVYDNNLALLPRDAAPKTKEGQIEKIKKTMFLKPFGGEFDTLIDMAVWVLRSDESLVSVVNNVKKNFIFRKVHGMEDMSDYRLEFYNKFIKVRASVILSEYAKHKKYV